MHHYRIYLLDEAGRIFSAHDFEGPDDQSALDASLSFCEQHAVEIWQGARRVARLTRGCEPA